MKTDSFGTVDRYFTKATMPFVMNILRVGDLYPNRAFYGARDTAVIEMTEDNFNAVVFFDRPSTKVLKAFNSGPYTYGLYQKDKVPFFTLHFEFAMFICPFNVLAFKDEFLQPWLAMESPGVVLFLVEANTYQISAMRGLGLHGDFTSALKDILKDQANIYPTASEVFRQSRKIMGEVSSVEMISRSRKFKMGR